MSRLARRRARHAAWTVGVLLLVLVALLPGATYSAGAPAIEVQAPYERQAGEEIQRPRRPFEDVEIKRIGPPPVLAKNSYGVDVEVEWSVPASWGLAPSHEMAAGHWPDPPGWAFVGHNDTNPYLWIPPMPYDGWDPQLGPTSGGGTGITLRPTNTLGGGGSGGGASIQPVPEPSAAWLLALGLMGAVRPGRRPLAASTSQACPSI